MAPPAQDEGVVPGLIPVGLDGACTVLLRLPVSSSASGWKLGEKERAAVVAALGDDERGADAIDGALQPLLRVIGKRWPRMAFYVYLAIIMAASFIGCVIFWITFWEGAYLLIFLPSIGLFVAGWPVMVWLQRRRRLEVHPVRAEVLENLNALRFRQRPRGVAFRVSMVESSAKHPEADLVMDVAAPAESRKKKGAGSDARAGASAVALPTLPPWAPLGPNETLESRRLYLGDMRESFGPRVPALGNFFFSSSVPRTASLLARTDFGVNDQDVASFVDRAEGIFQRHRSLGVFGSFNVAVSLYLLLPFFFIPGVGADVLNTVLDVLMAGLFLLPLSGFMHSLWVRNKILPALKDLADEMTAQHPHARFHADGGRLSYLLVAPPLALSAKDDTDHDDGDLTIVVKA